MPQEHINSLIISFLTNDISDDEMKELQQWTESDNANAEYFNQYIESWMIAGHQDELKTFDRAAILGRYESQNEEDRRLRRYRNTRKLVLKYFKMAASWLVFFFWALLPFIG